MALHIQMSEEALRELKRTALINRLVSFGVCAGLLLLFGGILYFTILIIAGDVPTEFITYTPPSEDGPPTNQPVNKELSSKSAATAPSVTPSVIVAQNAVSAVAAPVSIDTTGEMSFDDLTVSMDMGSLGDGLGDGGAGLGSGSPGGSTLEGTFYDLKLTRSGAPSKVANVVKKNAEGKTYTRNGKPFPALVIRPGGWSGWTGSGGAGSLPKPYDAESNPSGFKYIDCTANVLRILKEFHNRKWDTRVFAPYFVPDTKLYTSSFYIPMTSASYAPEAYQCADRVQDGGWVCVYKGRVRAPKTGKFRFVGTGDDYLGVRFNNDVVLQAGYLIPSLFEEPGVATHHLSGMQDPNAKSHKVWADVKAGKVPALAGQELVQVKGCNTWNRELGGLVAGKVFSVKEGETYPIQIVISEVPGGAFGCMLLIEDVTDGKKAVGGKYDIFRTNFNMPNKAQYYGLVEASNFKAAKELREQKIREGKLPADKRLKDEVYDKFAEAIEKISQDLLDGKASDETPLPPGSNQWFDSKDERANNSFFRYGQKPGNVGGIEAPDINEDSPIWTAVP